MKRMRVIAGVAMAVAGASTSASDAAEGTIELGSARVEVLSKALPVGRRIDLPEGWFRVEEEGVEDREAGSFTVTAAREETPAVGTALPDAARTEGVAADDPTLPRTQGACRTERSAYLRQLWKESGIEVEDPEALLAGLDAGTSGPATGFGWFALQTDAFRNLASSSELRARARDLARCVREDRDDAR